MHRDTEVVFFLGDGLLDIENIAVDFPAVMFYRVRGNCDFGGAFSDVKKTDILTLLGKRILLTHGDLYGVKGGVGGIISLGRKNGCDLVLFGHTHIPYEYYDSESGTYLFNPGSISESYSGRSFGVITVTEKDILLSHGHVS
jgi:putative phosphoesterase